MSWRLVGDVLAYTKRLDPPLHPRDQMILVTLAEEARDPSRRSSPGAGVLAEAVGLSGRGLRKALQRLARRGLEVRVAIMTGADGRPVYAVPGQLQVYRVPPLPVASLQVRQGGTERPPDGTQGPPGGTGDPPGDPSEGSQVPPGGSGTLPPDRSPSPLALDPSPPKSPRDDDLDARIAELERVVVGVLQKKGTPIPGRTQLRTELSRLVRLQWTPEQVQAVLEGHSWHGSKGGGVVIKKLKEMQSPGDIWPPLPTEAAQDRPAWCRACNETTRLIEDPQSGVPRRCPNCHPSTRRDTA